jgi:hypothetical protein
MRRLLVLLLLAGCAVAQDAPQPPARGGSAHLPPVPQVSAQVSEQLVPVTHADLYCSGYLAKAPARKDTYVLGGLDSPHQTRFHQRDFVFINGDYPAGTRVSFVRQTKDVDRTEAFKGQTAALGKSGDVFGELGYAVVVEKRGDATVAQVEFSCDAIVPGDYVVPFVARPEVTYRKRTTVDHFPEKVQTVGRIIAARDFDQYVGAGQKVYFDVGTQKGLKPGDMFLVVRSYRRDEMDATDVYEFKTGVFEETRKNEPKMPRNMENKMPDRVIAEAVVLNVQDGSATAMITFSLNEVHVGDRIASENPSTAMPATGAANYTTPAKSAKGHRLGPLCVFAILNCGKESSEPAQGNEAGAGAPSAGAAR